MGGYVFENFLGEAKTLQELQTLQQAPGAGGIVAGFKLAQPDEARHAALQCFRKQFVESPARVRVETAGDSLLYPSVGSHCGIGAQAFKRRDRGHDDLPQAAFLDKASCQLFVGVRFLGLPAQPCLQVPGGASGERAVSVDRAHGRHVFMARLAPRCIGQQGLHRDAQLDGDKCHDLGWDQFAGLQRAAGIAQGTELKGETEAILGAPAPGDVFQVIVSQGVMPP